MDLNRRDFLKMAGAGLGSIVVPAVPSVKAASGDKALDSMAMLYDTTLCVGCRACQTACKDRAGLPPVTDEQGLFEAPTDLTANAWTIIKLYQGEEGVSFVKNQCMHCVDPACVSVCPVAALDKTPEGPVVYHDERCIGCRYCMTACPFDVPKYQWDKVSPLVQKCDFCADRQAQGLEPACGAVCPTGALITGRRGDMLEIAHRRLEENPDKYVNHVYGENEVGGTSMLYLAHVPFEKLGYPLLNSASIPEITWPYMKAVPFVFFGMGAVMTAIYYVTHRGEKNGKMKEEDQNGS